MVVDGSVIVCMGADDHALVGLSFVQSVFELAASVSQFTLILPKVSSVPGYFLVIVANLLSITKNFLFAGAAADISAKLGFILSQLLVVAS
jgi:hypothetical protein